MTLTCGLEVTEGRWKWYHLKAWYGFLFAFRSNYGRICSRLWDIQCQRMAWPWKQVRGRSRSLKMAPFNRPYATFYWSAIVNIALSVTFSSYWTLNIIVTLTCGLEVTEGHWKLVPFENLGTVSYSSSLVTMAVCEIFSVKQWRDLGNQVRGRSRSSKMAPFDIPYATFYWSAIVNIALSCTIFELFDVE